MALFAAEFEDPNQVIIPDKPEMSWAISGTRPADPQAAFIEDLTVTPSIDASKSGHWHGFITKNKIK